MSKYNTAGTAPFNELDFWLYQINGMTLKAEYPEPFRSFDRADAALTAEQAATPQRRLVLVPLPPPDVEGKQPHEILSRVAELQADWTLRNLSPAGNTLTPKLVAETDATGEIIGRAYFYKFDKNGMVLSRLLGTDLPDNVVAVGSGDGSGWLTCQSMRHAAHLQVQLTGLKAPWGVIALPYDNAVGASMPYAAKALLVLASSTKEVQAAKVLAEAKAAAHKPAATPAPVAAPPPKRTFAEVAVASLVPGEAYFRGQDCMVGMTITATHRDVATMPDGGKVYGVCVETGRLYSTVTDGALTWKHIDGGLS